MKICLITRYLFPLFFCFFLVQIDCTSHATSILNEKISYRPVARIFRKGVTWRSGVLMMHA